MTKQEWDALADRCIGKLDRDEIEDIMLRASFEHSKTYEMATTEDQWLQICRDELKAMLAALCVAGYAVTRVDS